MSSLLLIKLFLAPTIVAIVTKIQRRWGEKLGGRLIGLPLTTGPFIFIVLLQEGRTYAGHAAHGVLVGEIALIVFTWLYAFATLRMSWAPALAIGTFGCLITGAIVTSFEIPLLVLVPSLTGLWILGMKFWPQYSNPLQPIKAPWWELPGRLVFTVALILVLSGFATLLGPRVAGALSTYPVITSVLGAFTQKRIGPSATIATMHGMMQSLPISMTIMTVLAITL